MLNEVQQSLFIDRHSKKSGLTSSTDLTGKPLQRYKDTPHYLNALSILWLILTAWARGARGAGASAV